MSHSTRGKHQPRSKYMPELNMAMLEKMLAVAKVSAFELAPPCHTSAGWKIIYRHRQPVTLSCNECGEELFRIQPPEGVLPDSFSLSEEGHVATEYEG